MKRVNLLTYSALGEHLHKARAAFSSEKTKGSRLYFSCVALPDMLRRFVAEDNGFHTSKHAATDVATAIDAWVLKSIFDGKADNFVSASFDKEFEGWQIKTVLSSIDYFKNVFTAECRDVEIYSVDQVSIYKTSTLVSSGSDKIPSEVRAVVPEDCLREFDGAGKCLAFDLPTACGFHSLRGLELMMSRYLIECGGGDSEPKSWYDYVQAFEKLEAAATAKRKPSKKVVAMIDRMRQLDRNPLMHPHDVLDILGADMLFNLCAITVIEMARDLLSPKSEITLIEGGKTA